MPFSLLDPDYVPNIDPVIVEMENQNDRGTAITGGIFVERKLREGIESQWPPMSNTTANKLFMGMGPLSTFSAKIEIADGMGLISKHTKAELNRIRIIRNDAAHIGTQFSFEDAKVSKHIASLSFWKIWKEDGESYSNRAIFIMSVKMAFAVIFFARHWKKKFGHLAVYPGMIEPQQ